MIHFIFKNNHKLKRTSVPDNQPNKDKFFIFTDLHSHLLPGIDDGSQSLEESENLIRRLIQLGYRKLITTPHIMQDYYRNTPEIILEKLQTLQEHLQKKQIEIELSAAAEYYLDEYFIDLLAKKKTLLTFGDNYLLFETSYINQPTNLFETVFLMQSMGYKPVLAHPERYLYLQQQFAILEKLHEYGVLFQLNINSLSGYYSRNAQIFAETLVNKSLVSFVGSDCHKIKHLDQMELSRSKKYFAKLCKIPLLNHQL
ncbi:MAG: CpsB/CapC family capsule biosynthesis tyrosine phosphatase [Microscillaceae bacterium]|nr:CpsB/CapC family capsule biosynthesis tyrosine phosphatase [Microscillaceae bacterium]